VACERENEMRVSHAHCVRLESLAQSVWTLLHLGAAGPHSAVLLAWIHSLLLLAKGHSPLRI